MTINTISDDSADDVPSSSLVFYGPEQRPIGPLQDPRCVDSTGYVYHTWMIDPLTGKDTDDIYKLDDFQWDRYRKRMLGNYLDR